MISSIFGAGGRVVSGQSAMLPSSTTAASARIGTKRLIACTPNAKVSDRSQPPLMVDLSQSESSGSDSLHRLVRLSCVSSWPVTEKEK
jgi:hypothetical protein